jgi:ribosomal protein S17
MAIAETGEITVFNQVMDKTIVVTISQIVYKRLAAYEID